MEQLELWGQAAILIALSPIIAAWLGTALLIFGGLAGMARSMWRRGPDV